MQYQKQSENPYTNFRFNNRDVALYSIFLLAGILLIYNQITTGSLSSYGGVYIPIFFIGLILVIAAWVSGGRFGNVVFFGVMQDERRDKWVNLGKIAISIGGGIILGILSISTLLGVPTFSVFSQNVTLPINSSVFAIAAGLTSTALSLIFIIGLLAPLVEDTVFQGVLVPTFSKLLGAPNQLPLIMIFGGLIFVFLFNQTAAGYIVGGILMAAGLIIIPSQKLKETIAYKDLDRFIIAAVLVAFIFASFHTNAYKVENASLTNAFIFFLVAATYNYWRKDITGGLALHTINNSVVVATLLHTPLYVAAFVSGSLIGLVLLAFYFGKYIKITGLSFGRGVSSVVA